ncbi:hypothetical protein OROMI_019851 [Orobanche minor]
MANSAVIKSIVLLGMMIISSMFVVSSGARLLSGNEHFEATIHDPRKLDTTIMSELGIYESMMEYYRSRAKALIGQKRLAPGGPDAHHH